MPTYICILVLFLSTWMVSCSSQLEEPIVTVTVSVDVETDFVFEVDRGNYSLSNTTSGYFYTNMETLNDEIHWAMFSHAPNAVRFDNIFVGENATLDFSIGMLEGAWDREGDGVRFEIALASVESGTRTIYSRVINPIANKDERRWIPESVALDSVANSTQTFIFETFPGAIDDASATASSDWAVWGKPRLTHDGVTVTNERSKRPNVLLVTIDTLRADHVGAYGHPWVQTPHLDALAERGTLFENAHTAINYTNPSHFSMLTSLHPFTHEISHNFVRIKEPIPALPMVMKEQDYRTAAIVSVWHLDIIISNMSEALDQVIMPSDIHKVRPDVFTTTAAIDYMEEDDSRPFFLWVHLFYPHTPYAPVSPYHKQYYDGGDPYDPENRSLADAAYPPEWIPSIQSLPEHWLYGLTDFDYTLKQYAAEVTASDAQLGRLVDAMDRLELTDNTLLIVTSDHGEALSDHNIWYDHWTLYEHDIHVPLIVSMPGVVPEGKRVSQDVSTLDIAPTIVDYLDAEDHPGTALYEGRSLQPLWQGETLPFRYGTADSSFGNHTAVWNERYKIIWELRDGGFNKKHFIYNDRVFIFDRQNDPEEVNPVAEFTWMDDGSMVPFMKPETDPEITSFSGVTYYEIKQEKAGKAYPSGEAIRTFIETIGTPLPDEQDYERLSDMMAYMMQRIQTEGIWEKINQKEDMQQWLSLYSDIPQDFAPGMMDHLRELGYLGN